MKCEEYRKYFADYYMDRLRVAEKAELEQHLSTCIDCRDELAATQMVLDSINGLQNPEPSARMKVNFRAMLDDFKAAEEKSITKDGFWKQFKKSWVFQPRLPLAYGLIILLICTGAVYWLGRSSRQEENVQNLHDRVDEPKQTIMLAMLNNPLASERLRAVNYTSEIRHADKRVIDALLATLNNDPNDNVRLSTLEALAQMADKPEVRMGLIQSITKQDSPVVQIAIAEVMLKLQEKHSVGSFKELLKHKDLDSEVKEKVQQTITKLI